MSIQVNYLVDGVAKALRTLRFDTVATEFQEHLLTQIRSSSSFQDMAQGIPPLYYMDRISDTLQAVAENTSHEKLHNDLWNPIVASIISSYRQVISDYMDLKGKVDSYFYRQTTPKTKREAKGKSIVVRNEKTVVVKSPTTQKKTRKSKSKSVTLDVTKPLEQSFVPTAIQQVAAAVEKDTLDPTDYAEIRALAKEKHFFKQRKVMQCKIVDCTFCPRAILHVPLSPCSSVSAHGAGLCHSSGWYPHISRPIVGIWSRHHATQDWTSSEETYPVLTLPFRKTLPSCNDRARLDETGVLIDTMFPDAPRASKKRRAATDLETRESYKFPHYERKQREDVPSDFVLAGSWADAE